MPLCDDNEEESARCYTNATSELQALLQTSGGGALPEIAQDLGIAPPTLGKLVEAHKKGGSTLPGS